MTIAGTAYVHDIEPIHFPNECDIVKKLFLPLAQSSNRFDCISGYFSSNVLSELAEPLAVLFKKQDSKGRFLISPNLSIHDKEAILKAYDKNLSILDYLIPAELTKNALENATLDALKWLIYNNKVDIRIVVMKEGMLHAKVWLFYGDYGEIALHGSSNATQSGLIRNFEQLIVTKAWTSDESKVIFSAYNKRFEQFWNGHRDDSFTLKLNNRTHAELFSKSLYQPAAKAMDNLIFEVSKIMNENLAPKLNIPTWLNYRRGDYSHQGDAVDAWITNLGKGTFEIATGGGKTLTSLICASLALKDENAAILIIAVPNIPLIKQWADDVRYFGIEPIDTEGMGTKSIVTNVRKVIKEHQVLPKHTVFIITHDALKTEEFKDVLRKYKQKIMLIGDEVHNLGAASFVDSPPEYITLRLGLSATPMRQYDPDGTKKLLDYFGEIIYEYPLEMAIGTCLVPFDYIAHKVYMNKEEVDEWLEYTEKINRLSWSDDADAKKQIEQWQIRRRAISEATKNKVYSFNEVVSKLNDRKHSIVFCTDKSPEQLRAVNEVLRREKFIFHQVTGEESQNKNLMKSIVDEYKRGDIEVLTSKRVLDEGFNIPPIKTAYFLASSGTTRTWVQRLGRVLRKSNSTGKTKAVVHDFVVFPPNSSTDFSALINSELTRMQWFMKLANNDKSLNDAIKISNELLSMKGAK